MIRGRIVQWDYREQPDFEAIQRAMKEVFNGDNCPSVVLVPDTRGDQYAVAVCGTPLDAPNAQAMWDSTCFACWHGDHAECDAGDCVCICNKPRIRHVVDGPCPCKDC